MPLKQVAPMVKTMRKREKRNAGSRSVFLFDDLASQRYYLPIAFHYAEAVKKILKRLRHEKSLGSVADM